MLKEAIDWQHTRDETRSLSGRPPTTASADRLDVSGQLRALMLARWPLRAPLPGNEQVAALLPAALVHARQRLAVLRAGRGDERVQQGLTAAFLRRVRTACGGAVSPAFAPFARLRFVAAGGLERAWAWEREVHRFPVERVALCRAALQVAADAESAAAVCCVPLLRAYLGGASAAAAAGGSTFRVCERETQLYAVVRAVGRWGEIRAAVTTAERGVRGAEAALGTAIEGAEAAQERLAATQSCVMSTTIGSSAAPHPSSLNDGAAALFLAAWVRHLPQAT